MSLRELITDRGLWLNPQTKALKPVQSWLPQREIYPEGTPARNLVLIHSGIFILSSSIGNGTEFKGYGEGPFLAGTEALEQHGTYESTLTSVTTLRSTAVPAEIAQRMIQHPEISTGIKLLMEEQGTALLSRVTKLGLGLDDISAKDRFKAKIVRTIFLVHLLKNRYPELDSHNSTLLLLAGYHNHNISPVLKTLQEAGFIHRGRKKQSFIKILDEAGLQQIANPV